MRPSGPVPAGAGRSASAGAAGWAAMLVAGAALSTLFSIFVAQLLLGAAVVCWVVDCLGQKRLVVAAPASTLALGAFVIWSVVAVAASDDPSQSAWYLKKHLRLVMLPLATTYLGLNLVRRWLPAFLALLAASAVYGILQYAGLKQIDLLHRIDGFMSHWMTFSAQLMMGLLIAVALIAFARTNSRLRVALMTAAALPAAALVLTMTRSALLGAVAGLLVLAQLRFSWRALLAVAAVVATGILLLPAPFQQRLESALDPEDTTTRGRLDLLRTGLQMVAAHPLTGVGPRRVPIVADVYRVEREAPETLYQHLHNNAVEIAASMGLPALLFWGVWWIWLTLEVFILWRRAREPLVRATAAAALACVAAFQLAGLFEYNFGDAEVVMLLLFVVAVPMAHGEV